MLGASVSYAQGPPVTFPQTQQASVPADPYGLAAKEFRLTNEPGTMYVACRAEVPSHNTAYFSATFPSPTVNSARKEFRKVVTTQYGRVGKLQCASKFNETVVNEQVAKWKDSARSTKNAIVDTDWQPVAALSRTLQPSAQAKN